MCPSYMATRKERDTTRARANILREMLTRSQADNPFGHEEIKDIMDLCLSCKGCKAECPSNVDVAKLKAEFQHQYYKSHGIPFRTRMIAAFDGANALASKWPGGYNFLVTNPITAPLFKWVNGFASKRSIPTLHPTTFRKWLSQQSPTAKPSSAHQVILFCDEFTNYHDTPLGITAYNLLNKLGIQPLVSAHLESGRTLISKGILDKARDIAIHNIEILSDQVGKDCPLVGIEPSAILTFRDEYLDLVPADLKHKAQHLADHCYTLEEYLGQQLDNGKLTSSHFTDQERLIRLHGHCHQKALSSMVPTKKLLSLPANYQVQMIPSGCCGMAGSFGYEQEHYELSMQIGEMVLFPAIRKSDDQVIIAAPGTSCRHQIKDGTGRTAFHPIEILYQALL